MLTCCWYSKTLVCLSGRTGSPVNTELFKARDKCVNTLWASRHRLHINCKCKRLLLLSSRNSEMMGWNPKPKDSTHEIRNKRCVPSQDCMKYQFLNTQVIHVLSFKQGRYGSAWGPWWVLIWEYSLLISFFPLTFFCFIRLLFGILFWWLILYQWNQFSTPPPGADHIADVRSLLISVDLAFI